MSRVDRITYATDTATASVRGPLSTTVLGAGATGSTTFGWFGGGRSNLSTRISVVNRIDYAADTVTASIRGSLSLARSELSATGGYPG